eukprot:scaffold406_cov391-Prasinococcus_capsulatus_cf.AAC.20
MAPSSRLAEREPLSVASSSLTRERSMTASVSDSSAIRRASCARSFHADCSASASSSCARVRSWMASFSASSACRRARSSLGVAGACWVTGPRLSRSADPMRKRTS